MKTISTHSQSTILIFRTLKKHSSRDTIHLSHNFYLPFLFLGPTSLSVYILYVPERDGDGRQSRVEQSDVRNITCPLTDRYFLNIS